MKRSDLIQWNCRGVDNKRLELQILAHMCKTLVFAIQETKKLPSKVFKFSGFEVFTKDETVTQNGHAHGGVAILARRDVAPIPVRLNTHFQAIAVSVKFHKRITICSIYIPPGSNNDFTERELENLLRQLPKPYLLLGDFNAHNTLWFDKTMCGRGRVIENVIINNDCFFLDQDKDTHIYSNNGVSSSSHIDLSIASLDLLQEFEWGCYEDLMRSDHYPIWLRSGRNSRPKRFPKWILDKADWDKFQREAVPRMTVQDFDTASDMGQYVTNVIIGAANESIPKTTGNSKNYSAIWFDSECIEAKKARNDALKDWKAGRNSRENWKRKEAEAQRVFQRVKRRSWREFVDGINEETTPKEMWRKIGLLTNKYTSKDVTALKVGGRIIDDCEEIADCIAAKLEQRSSEESCSPEFLRYKNRIEGRRINFRSGYQGQEYNDPITRQELDAVLQDLKDSAPGPDEVHNKMLKNLPEEGKVFLLEFLNKVFQEGDFPDDWRLAHVIPLLKDGKDPLDPESYRPISLTSCICKLIERILAKRASWFLENVGLIDKSQNGSRKGRSPIDSLVALENEVHEAIVNNRLLVSLFIDLKGAYDTCWDYLILKELHNNGLRGNLGIFIEEFMKNRRFRVRVGNKLSGIYRLLLGVPQGSVLSGMLFLIAVNTVLRFVPDNIARSLYLDDMRFSIEVATLCVAERKMNELCKQLVTWMRVTGFRISLTKTKLVVFHRRSEKPTAKNPVLDFTLQVKLDGVQLEVVKEYKFLGLIFDHRLTWHLQVGKLRRGCMRSLGGIKVIAKYSRNTKREKFLKIYKAVVLSKLDYGCQVYGTATEDMLKRLDPIHHAALRLSTGAFRTSNRFSLYVESYVPSLWDRRKYMNLCFMFRSQCIPKDDRLSAWEDTMYDERYQRFKSRPKAFGFLARKNCIELDLDIPVIRPNRSYSIPPWRLSQLHICLVLGSMSKRETSSEVFMQTFLEHKHVSDVEIYTDGSKMDDKVGSGVLIQGGAIDRELSEPLGKFASVYTAELVAIRIALVHIRNRRNLKVTVYSDSRSSLQALAKFNSDNILIQDIQELVHELSDNNVKVTFCWVPSHIGIPGNEKADELAKLALGYESPRGASVLFSDYKGYIRKKLFDRWKDSWNDMVDDRITQLRKVQNYIKPRRWGQGLTRLEDIKITRLRIGHTRFARDYYFTGDPNVPPECLECGEILTVEHVLLECGNFYQERHVCFGDENLSLPSLLGNPDMFHKVLEFFKAIDMYSKI